jgi:uncharacterized membrane protein YphA (DoxX/SURF4 family)
LNGGRRTAILAPAEARRGRCVISVLALTLRFAVATVLAVAAVEKGRSFTDFRRTVEALVPWTSGVTAIAGTVIAIEAALAVLLAAGVVPTAVAAVAVGLFLAFAALWLWAVRRGIHLQCNLIRRLLDIDDRSTPISLGNLAGRPLPEPASALWNGAAGDGVSW